MQVLLEVTPRLLGASDPLRYILELRTRLQIIHLNLLVQVLRHLDELPIDWPLNAQALADELDGLAEPVNEPDFDYDSDSTVRHL